MNKNTFSWLCVQPKPRIKVLTSHNLFRVFAFVLLSVVGVMPSIGQESSCAVSRIYTSPDASAYIEPREYASPLLGEMGGMTKADSEWHTSGKKVSIEHSLARSVVNFRVTDNGTGNINGLQSCVNEKTTDEDGVWHSDIRDYTGRLKMIEDNSDNTGIKGSVHTAYYYDYRRRVVQSRSTNAKGGSDIVYTQYTFTGKPLKVRSNHSSGTVSNLQELTEYSYDHAERLLTVDHTIGSGSKRRLRQNTYDTFGRLSACRRFGKTALNTQYGYNIQSSLKSLSTGNLFGETLYYQENYNGSTPKYNGGISAMTWSASGANVLRGYRFSYDQKSRLTSAQYLANGSRSTNYDVSYGYDSMGNITSLVRNGRQDGGTWGKVNQLTYSYNGNQLTKVSDNVSSPTYNGFFGFIDGANIATEYEYDANGNMKKDRNKGISSITCNTLNLPSRIEYENGSRATYLYSADGTKFQVKYETSYAGLLASGPPSGSASTAIADIHTIDYVGNKIYEDGVLSRILVEGGYVDYNGGTPIYHAYLTDHQGNVRVVVDENAVVKQVNHYYPYGALFAESTNGGVQPYKYNGKELDRMHGLDWYDHGARHNDAAIGRWHVMDPLCEKYYDVSPYNFCLNNPISNIDTDGRAVETGWDLFNVGLDIASISHNVIHGNIGAAIVDGVCLFVDAAATAIPFVPGGAGVSVKAVRSAEKTVGLSNLGKSNNVATMAQLRQKSQIGQEAHRQIEREIIKSNPGAKAEQTIRLGKKQTVRKDVVGVDGKTVYIIKPNTKTGRRTAQKRADLMKSHGYKPQIVFYDPTDSRWLIGSPTYIGPKK